MNQTEEYKFAIELANMLKDEKSMAWYCEIVKRYNEDYLRDMLKRVLSIPEDKIKKSRAALFNHMVNNNGGQHFRD